MSQTHDEFLRSREVIRQEMGGLDRIEALHRAGRRTVRENIEDLVDPGSFEEIGTFAVSDVDTDRNSTPGDGKIGGHATIDGRPVTIAGDDVTVKRGSSSVVGGIRMARLYEQAERSGNAFIYLGATGGARIPDSLGSEGLSRMPPPVFLARRRRRIPVVTVITGDSFGGSSFISAMSDLAIQVRGTCLAVTSPNVVEIATGEEVSGAELGGADVHARRTGQIDMVAETETEASGIVRRFLGYLPSNSWSGAPPHGRPAALEPDADLPALVPPTRRRAYDMRKVIGRLVDFGDWLELRPDFGRSTLTGLGRIGGHAVGLIASQPMHYAGVLGPDACDKATRMLCLCDAFDIPVVLLQDCPGFLVGRQAEHSRLLYKAILLLQAIALARVPKLTVVLRKAYGLAYYALGGNDMGTDLLCCWPGAEISLMDPEVAANVVHKNELRDLGSHERRATAVRLGERLGASAGPQGAAGVMKVDEIIDPVDTRPVLGRALSRLESRNRRRESVLASWPTCW